MVMILHVREAKYLRDYVIWLRFNDGAEGEIDLADQLEGEIFGPLKDIEAFKSFRVDPDLGRDTRNMGLSLLTFKSYIKGNNSRGSVALSISL